MSTEHIRPGIDPGFFQSPHGIQLANEAADPMTLAIFIEKGTCSYIEKVTSIHDNWEADVCNGQAEVYLIFNGSARSFCQSCYDDKYVKKGEVLVSREEALVFLTMES